MYICSLFKHQVYSRSNTKTQRHHQSMKRIISTYGVYAVCSLSGPSVKKELKRELTNFFHSCKETIYFFCHHQKRFRYNCQDESRLFAISFSFPVNRPLLVHVRIVFEEEPAEWSAFIAIASRLFLSITNFVISVDNQNDHLIIFNLNSLSTNP